MPFHNFGPSSIQAFFMDGSSETANTMPLLSDSFFFHVFDGQTGCNNSFAKFDSHCLYTNR